MSRPRAPTAGQSLARIGDWACARGLDFRHDSSTGSGAVFSRCGRWRYLLWRIGRPRASVCGMGLLNPSTADERRDDPTIRQCRARARQAGSANLLVWNLFAWCATLPADLRRAADPIGPRNDEAIALALGLCRRTILAWGNHGAHLDRDRAVLELCRSAGIAPLVLGLTAYDQPRHPLYMTSDTKTKCLLLTRLPAARYG